MTFPEPSSDLTAVDTPAFEGEAPVLAKVERPMPTVDRVVSLTPGFVYVFNHTTYSNDYTNCSVAEQLASSAVRTKSLLAAVFPVIVRGACC